jgi:hypothetical protein
MARTAKSNGRNRKKNQKVDRAGRKPKKSRGECTCRTFRKFCDVLCAARLSHPLSKSFLKVSVRNAKPTLDLARIAVTSIQLHSLSAHKRSQKELRRRISETIASSSWRVRRSNVKPAIPAEGRAARALPAQPVLLMPVVPLTICSRSREFFAANYADYANGAVRVICSISGYYCYSGDIW